MTATTKTTTNAHFNPGDIIDGSASGRGDSVYVYFYQVVSATNKTVVFREIEKKLATENDYSRGWMPDVGNFTSPPKRKKIQHWSSSPTVEVRYGTEGRLWDGEPSHSHTDHRA